MSRLLHELLKGGGNPSTLIKITLKVLEIRKQNKSSFCRHDRFEKNNNYTKPVNIDLLCKMFVTSLS